MMTILKKCSRTLLSHREDSSVVPVQIHYSKAKNRSPVPKVDVLSPFDVSYRPKIRPLKQNAFFRTDGSCLRPRSTPRQRESVLRVPREWDTAETTEVSVILKGLKKFNAVFSMGAF